MSKKLRMGVVGVGGMGSGHAMAIHSGTGYTIWSTQIDEVPSFPGEMTCDLTKYMELAGVYDINPARNEWAANHGMHVFESYEAMIADPNVDGVIIAVPNYLHKGMAIAAMRAGKHVLCEKPVMMSSEELLEVMEVSKETGMVFYPRQNREWDEDYLIVKKIYDEKLVGEVFNIKCRIMGSRGIPGDWRGVKEYGGGMMLDWGVHIIDRMLKMTPEKVTNVFCHFTYITNPECDDGFQLHMTFESGMTVNLEVGTCHFVNEPLWCVYGDKGSAMINSWNLDGKLVRLVSWDDKDVMPILAGAGLTKTMAPRDGGESIETFDLPRFDFDRNELYRNFVETCNGEAEQIVTQEHALRVLRLMEACFESHETGKAVAFEA